MDRESHFYTTVNEGVNISNDQIGLIPESDIYKPRFLFSDWAVMILYKELYLLKCIVITNRIGYCSNWSMD